MECASDHLFEAVIGPSHLNRTKHNKWFELWFKNNKNLIERNENPANAR